MCNSRRCGVTQLSCSEMCVPVKHMGAIHSQVCEGPQSSRSGSSGVFGLKVTGLLWGSFDLLMLRKTGLAHIQYERGSCPHEAVIFNLLYHLWCHSLCHFSYLFTLLPCSSSSSWCHSYSSWMTLFDFVSIFTSFVLICSFRVCSALSCAHFFFFFFFMF